MKIEVFKEFLNRMREQSDKIDKAHSANIDLINFTDDYSAAISILLSAYYGAEGKEWVDWYLYESDRIKGSATDKDGNPICYDDESLWELVEKGRLDKEEYELPRQMTYDEKLDFLNSIFG